MYSIYHIKGVKIGCSTNPSNRVKRQGYTEFEILESYDDIIIAARREKELQKEYGYEEKNVHTDYVQQYEFGKKGRENQIPGIGAATQIKNKIGIFGYSKEERQKLNASIAHKGGNVTKERYSKAINVYDYYTNKLIDVYPSLCEAARKLNVSRANMRAVIYGDRNHTKGYTFRYAV